MEIERKFTVKELPEDFMDYKYHEIEQGYLSTDPVVRIRREDDSFYLTYKGKGLLAREEYNLPLTAESYEHLLTKVDGIVISKRRYLIPLDSKHTIELDLFKGALNPLVVAEVEFESEEDADAFEIPDWFDKEVTYDRSFTNAELSKLM